MDPRSELDQIRQRAENASPGTWRTWRDGHVGSPTAHIGGICMPTPGSNPDTRMPDAEFIAAARTDVPRLVAALTAALDLADECEEVASLAVFNEEWRDAHTMFATTLRAAITEHLTRKGKPHLAIAKLTSWRETATAVAAGLGTQPVEWLDEDDGVREAAIRAEAAKRFPDDGEQIVRYVIQRARSAYVDGYLAAAAVLPEVERHAKADAWDEAYQAGAYDTLRSPAEATENPYREKGDDR